jgi:Flp pilus assembly protein TadB
MRPWLPSDRQQLPRQVQILHFAAVRSTGDSSAPAVRSPAPGPFSSVDRRLHSHIAKEQKGMLWTICIILLVLWALGMVTSYTAGGLIHILLVIAVVVLLFRLMSGRRVV